MKAFHMKTIDEMLHLALLTPEQHRQLGAWIAQADSPEAILSMPAALWHRAYAALVAQDAGARPFALVLVRTDGAVFRHDSRVLSAGHPAAALTLIYAERLLKFLLWM